MGQLFRSKSGKLHRHTRRPAALIWTVAATLWAGGFARAQGMSVTPNADAVFRFSGFQGGPFLAGTTTTWTLDGTVTLEGTDLDPVDFTATSNQPWLLVAPASGRLQGSTVVDRTKDVEAVIDAIEAGRLVPGVYTATVNFTNVTSGEGTTTRTVSLMVAPANFTVSPSYISVSTVENGANPAPVVVRLEGQGQSDLNYKVEWNPRAWFTVDKTAGTVPGGGVDAFTVSFIASVPAGNYSDNINILNTTNGNGSRQLPVSMIVQEGGTGSVVFGPDQDLEVIGPAGAILSSAQSCTLQNNSDAPVLWNASSSEAWVSVTPASGRLAASNHVGGGLDQQTINIRVNSAANDLEPGSHTATVSIENVTAGPNQAVNIGTRLVHVVAQPRLHVSVPLPGGSVTVAPDGGSVAGSTTNDFYTGFGEVVTLTVVIQDGFAFSGWGADFHLDNNLENPLVLTMDKSRSISAVIVPVDQTLTLSTSGAGTGTVKVTPTGSSIDNELVSSYNRGTQITITAEADAGSVFRGWAGNVPEGKANSNPLVVVMDTDRTITARFEPTIALTITSSDGGSVSIDPDLATYSPGAVVTLTAEAADGFVFAGWGGSGSGTSPTLTLTLNDSATVTATFVPDDGTNGGGSGGTPKLVVDIQGDGTVTPNGGTFEKGQAVTLVATPSITSSFVRWEGDASGTDLVATVVMEEDRQVRALFTAVADNGGGGTGRPAPGSTACGALGVLGLPLVVFGFAGMKLLCGRGIRSVRQSGSR